jgi:ketosteroid isomerase-like protein
MTAADNNQQLLQHVFAETAKGNGRPFVAALADDVVWTIAGSTAWSRSYRGKKAVLAELLAPLSAQLDGPNRITAHRFIAQDDQVVVEARGDSTTRAGKAYRNAYCWIFRLREGQVVEIMEYADTALIDAALEPPHGQP